MSNTQFVWKYVKEMKPFVLQEYACMYMWLFVVFNDRERWKSKVHIILNLDFGIILGLRAKLFNLLA